MAIPFFKYITFECFDAHALMFIIAYIQEIQLVSQGEHCLCFSDRGRNLYLQCQAVDLRRFAVALLDKVEHIHQFHFIFIGIHFCPC